MPELEPLSQQIKSGYMTEQFVIKTAEKAGFVLMQGLISIIILLMPKTTKMEFGHYFLSNEACPIKKKCLRENR